ncbi:MAG: potassium-transporting ATPase subunit KdpC [Thermoleophilaceae bacterium]|nr:potassium-transporting ATPase subunit KdpC [Thermoleophilaceae bacterium]
MRKDILTSVLAVIVFTVLCGLVYPLAVTGVSQVAFNNAANGSQIEQDGKVVGSRLIAQSFEGRRDYFQPRPSQTEYNPAGTYFNNAGPNNKDTRDLIAGNVRSYLALEGRFNPGLAASNVPVDAVTGSASGVDPHISTKNAEIQARRIATVRNLPIPTVSRLIDDNTDGRFLGLLGEPGVNVLELNLALDKESSR